MVNQKSLDEAYMQCAEAIAKLSHAKRKQVGAILVSASGHGIIAEGYNGTPSGFDNCCEYQTHHVLENKTNWCMKCHKTTNDKEYALGCNLITNPEVLHAESNAIAKVARSTNTSEHSTLYVTISPCFECSKQIIQAGIKRVIYREEYRITDGIDLLRKANIRIEKL